MLLLENARWQTLTYVHFLEIVTILLQTLVVHTNSSTFKLYKIAQYIKVGCMEPEEFCMVANMVTNYWILVPAR